MICGDSINGAVTVQQATGLVTSGNPPSCAGNQISGLLAVSQNVGGIQIGGNTVRGAIAVSINGTASGPAATAPVIDGNQISGSLSCVGNHPPPTDGGNANTIGGGRIGQCSSSGF
jgi:hypothetical protein